MKNELLNESKNLSCKKCGHNNTADADFCAICGSMLMSDITTPLNNIICHACNAENDSSNKYCQKCGTALTFSTQSDSADAATNRQLIIPNLIGKIICIVGGIIGALSCFQTIYADMTDYPWYDYTPPLTEHEFAMIFFIVISYIVFFIGCCISIYPNLKPQKLLSKLFAVLSYMGLLFLIPLIAKRKDDFIFSHAKQGAILYIIDFILVLLYCIAIIISELLQLTYITIILSVSISIITIILGIIRYIGLIYAIQGKKKTFLGKKRKA